MLKVTIDYVKSREAFGKSISQFQNTQFKIAEMATEIEMGRAFLDQLIAEHMDGQNVVTKVSMAKYKLPRQRRKLPVNACSSMAAMDIWKNTRLPDDSAMFKSLVFTREQMKS